MRDWILFAFLIMSTVCAQAQLGLPVGSLAPDFVQQDTTGNTVRLSDYRGRYILLEFWASWCGPCRKENPNLVRLYEKYRKDDFTIIAVSLDKERKAWVDAIQEGGLGWIHVSDLGYWDNTVAKLYNVSAIPYSFLIDPEGKIVARLLKKQRLEDKLAELFGE